MWWSPKTLLKSDRFCDILKSGRKSSDPAGRSPARKMVLLPRSRGLGRLILSQEDAGSNPAGSARVFMEGPGGSSPPLFSSGQSGRGEGDGQPRDRYPQAHGMASKRIG